MLVCLYNINPFTILYCKYNASLNFSLRLTDIFSLTWKYAIEFPVLFSPFSQALPIGLP